MCLKGHFTGAGVRGGALLRPLSPPVLLPAPLLSLEEGQGHSPDLDLPWAALEVPVSLNGSGFCFFPSGLADCHPSWSRYSSPNSDCCVPVSITSLSFLYLAVIVDHLVMLILPLKRVCAVRGWTFTLGFPIRPWTNTLIRDKIFKHG